MALPTKSEIEGFDVVCMGRPYLNLGTKADMNVNGMDIVYRGAFWYGTLPSVSTTNAGRVLGSVILNGFVSGRSSLR